MRITKFFRGRGAEVKIVDKVDMKEIEDIIKEIVSGSDIVGVLVAFD